MRIEPETLGFERVLAIGAHPDDGEFYAGATLARLAAAAAQTSLLVMTDGRRGSRAGEDMRQTRAAEQAAALVPLGIGAHRNLGRVDGELARDMELIGEIVLAIRSFRPDLILTHDVRTRFTIVDGMTQLGHSDHRATAEMVMDAVAPRAPLPTFFPEHFERPGVEAWLPKELWLFDTAEPNATVDPSPVLAAKQAALRAHASQNEKDGLVRWAAKRGDEGFVRLVLRRR